MCVLVGMENIQNSSKNLVLSTDSKPRFKWTSELHLRFVEAVNQLGGTDKATPKSLMRVMGVSGLTLYHLKSHLQKYRLGKSQQDGSCIDDKQEDNQEVQSVNDHGGPQRDIFKPNHDRINERRLQMAQALQMQMEVQKKLYEQIEVQRHLQARIEAQGKYLQSVLQKAQETLARFTSSSSSSLGIEFARAELSRLASMVNKRCPSLSLSELTEVEDDDDDDEQGCFVYKNPENVRITKPICSLESSLTSSESSGREEYHKRVANESDTRRSVELPLMEINPKKRSSEDAVCEEQPLEKRSKLPMVNT